MKINAFAALALVFTAACAAQVDQPGEMLSPAELNAPAVFVGNEAFADCNTTADMDMSYGLSDTQRCTNAGIPGAIHGILTPIAYHCATMPTRMQLVADNCRPLEVAIPNVICCPAP